MAVLVILKRAMVILSLNNGIAQAPRWFDTPVATIGKKRLTNLSGQHPLTSLTSDYSEPSALCGRYHGPAAYARLTLAQIDSIRQCCS